MAVVFVEEVYWRGTSITSP